MSTEFAKSDAGISSPRGAIFLSYASQDAAAVQRIAEALRSAGVEVWFDVEGGLETGDEWDTKIRRLIKECVLFIPVISANTQARHEGYFRIEWELAAQRALGIASGVPFILPVVIDSTREPEALVPDRFRAVQWTRLPGGEVSSEVRARLLKLWSQRSEGVKSPAAEQAAATRVNRPEPVAPRRTGNRRLILIATLVLAAGLGWGLWTGKRPAAPSPRATDSVASAASAPAEGSPPKASTAAVLAFNPDPKSIAVLAFTNLSDDKANEYFSDGISEELLNVLCRVPDLKVSARTSAFSFKGKNLAVPEVGRQLGVAYVVEGSVRKAGDKVRITAQLIKAADGFHVWSETFTRELKDVFGVQDEIAGVIARSLQIKLRDPEAVAAPTAVEGYDLILRARHLARQESNEGWRRAIETYREAVRQQPDAATAWAGMADAYVQLGRFNGMPAADAMQEARNAVRRALELAPNDPLALTTMGWVVRTADWKWREAREYFTRARAAQPGNAAAILALAVLELNLRHYEAALALAQQAVAADPLNAAAHFTLGTVYSMTDRPADAFPVYERAIALAPAAEEYRSHLSLMYARLGRHAEAEAEAKKETNPGYRLVATALSAALRGDQAAALQARAALVANHADDMAGYLTLVCTVLGDQEGSLEWMARSIARRDNGVPWAKCNLWVDRVRQRWGWDETRRDELLRRAGLADDQLN